MDVKTVLLKSLDESRTYLEKSVSVLSAEELAWTAKSDSMSIIFIYWHLIRVEDMWVNRVFKGGKELYESEGWQQKLGTPENESGFRYDEAKLKSWPVPDIETLKKYGAAVREKTLEYIDALDDKELSRVFSFGPRQMSVLDSLSHLITEIALHTGQIDYIRGMIQGLQA